MYSKSNYCKLKNRNEIRRKNPAIWYKLVRYGASVTWGSRYWGYTHRKSEPVSIITSKVCPPIVIGVKYTPSCLDSEAMTVPWLIAAALSTVFVARLLNLWYVDNPTAGPDLMEDLDSIWWRVNDSFPATSNVKADRIIITALPDCLKNTIMQTPM